MLPSCLQALAAAAIEHYGLLANHKPFWSHGGVALSEECMDGSFTKPLAAPNAHLHVNPEQFLKFVIALSSKAIQAAK